jgi:hypothetical protein
MAFPITELEKPHCGLTAKRSRGTKRLASRLSSDLGVHPRAIEAPSRFPHR